MDRKCLIIQTYEEYFHLNKYLNTNLHRSVVDRGEGRLEVGGLPLLQDDVLQRVAKLRSFGHCQLLLARPLELGLQILDLLKGVSVVAVQQESTSS